MATNWPTAHLVALARQITGDDVCPTCESTAREHVWTDGVLRCPLSKQERELMSLQRRVEREKLDRYTAGERVLLQLQRERERKLAAEKGQGTNYYTYQGNTTPTTGPCDNCGYRMNAHRRDLNRDVFLCPENAGQAYNRLGDEIRRRMTQASIPITRPGDADQRIENARLTEQRLRQAMESVIQRNLAETAAKWNDPEYWEEPKPRRSTTASPAIQPRARAYFEDE